MLVCSHGFTLDHRLFEPLAQALSRHCRIVLWDARGHGRSVPSGQPFSIAEAAQDLLAILDHLEIARAVLVGHSMGGYVSQELEFLHPERVAGMVMISSTCLTARPHFLIKLGGPLTRLAMFVWPESWTLRQIGWIAGVKREVKAYAARAARRVSRSDRQRIWAEILRGYHFERGHRIRSPLLLLHGDRDFIVGAGLIMLLTARWAAREPGCRYEVVPRAGHNANMDNPEFTNRVILEFLQTHFPQGGVAESMGQPADRWTGG